MHQTQPIYISGLINWLLFSSRFLCCFYPDEPDLCCLFRYKYRNCTNLILGKRGGPQLCAVYLIPMLFWLQNKPQSIFTIHLDTQGHRHTDTPRHKPTQNRADVSNSSDTKTFKSFWLSCNNFLWPGGFLYLSTCRELIRCFSTTLTDIFTIAYNREFKMSISTQ